MEHEGFSALHDNQIRNEPPTVSIAGFDLGSVVVLDPMIHTYNRMPILRGSATVTLSTVFSNAELRYTLNGNNPTQRSRLYDGPLAFKENMTGEKTVVKVRAYDRENAGRKSKIIRAEFRIIPSR